MDSFEKQVASIAKKTEEKMLAAARQAIDDLVRQAETPVAKGGKMRVDTGFLRNSGVAAINQMPVGQTEGVRRKGNQTGVIYSSPVNGDNLQTTLARWKLGETFFYGWTARYARIRETYDGYLETALQNWPSIAGVAISKVRKE